MDKKKRKNSKNYNRERLPKSTYDGPVRIMLQASYTVGQQKGGKHLQRSHGLCLAKMFKWLLGDFLQAA